MEKFRFRLNCVDWYLANPTECDPVLRVRRSGPQRCYAPPIPVIRVFGATETGQKVCAHIHGALPYLYLEYEGSLDQPAVDAYIQNLRVSIDYALAVAYRKDPYNGNAIYVAHISLVKGVPFFGYNVGYKVFLKVYLLNPVHMARLADLLCQGAIMNRVLQPHESHLQYILQWMCDYNLYGCGYIDCSTVQFRSPVPESSEIDTVAHKWHSGTIPPDSIIASDRRPRQSHCTLEIDVCVQDILNRHEVQPRPLHHDFVERLNPLNPEQKFVPSMAGLWRDETRRRKLRMGITDPSGTPFPAEVLVPMSADIRNSEQGGWIHEESYRELLERLVKEEGPDRPPVTFDTYAAKKNEALQHIKTALESVEDFYPSNFSSQIPIDELVSNEGAISDEMPMQNMSEEVEGNQLEEHTDEEGLVGSEVVSDEDLLNAEDTSLYALTAMKNSLRDTGINESSDTAVNTVGEGVSSDATEARKIELGDSIAPHKRASDFQQESQPTKRQRLLAVPSQTPVRRGSSQELDKGAGHAATSSQKKEVGDEAHVGPSSQSSIKANGGPSTLAFPVVKNPKDPETVLRLSQSGFSNSQEAPRTPKMQDARKVPPKITLTTPWSDQKMSVSATNTINQQDNSRVTALIANLDKTFPHSPRTYYYGNLPPSADEVEATTAEFDLPAVIYQDAYYSKDDDVPERPREYAGREFRIQSASLPYLPPFDSTGSSPANFGEQPAVLADKAKEEISNQVRAQRCDLRNWELSSMPPSFSEVNKWLKAQSKLKKQTTTRKTKPKPEPRTAPPELSQIDGPTQKNKHGFKFSQKKESTSVKHETQYMSILSVEVHANSRGSLVPDPAEDEIQAIFWAIEGEENGEDGRPRTGILCLSDEDGIAQRISRQVGVEVGFEDDELELLNRMVGIVREFDPDILTGYEVHNGSWGYLIERARLKYQYNLCSEFSRVKTNSNDKVEKDNGWGFTHTSTITITGRHMINIWRAMRGELNLLQYTMENVVFHLLHRRIPHYTYASLTGWYQSSKPRDLSKVLDYFISRVRLNLEILSANDIVPRTSEQARLLGVDFFSVISRGSQFKVESTMFRIAKPENFILPSPSRKQVGSQNALECLPLVMEPQSAFYTSPVLVLDFQSLYPSVMIAYNYCYSTCLGRIVNFRGRNKLGFKDFKRDPSLLALVKDHVNIAPNGLMYAKPSLRKSLLAKMLGELLETRVMVKSGMKADKDDKALQQLLNNRQLALKLLANVTYGYASASFSGRMPCSEIADSIVQTGRETLEKAIALIHSTAKWNAEVVYGDTDSLFIHLPGRTKDQAFALGAEISSAITATNPRPIKLKFEKVYHPCILLAKKRYVGFKYESPSQTEPEFDAKGIETVRRDGTPAEQKIEEKALKILFRTADLSQVKSYFQAQCHKILTGRISIQDFFFAKEVKLGTYSDKAPPPPGALVATKRMLADPRSEPQYGERIPYIVVTGAPGARLIDRCVDPTELLRNENLELDAEYYISKNIIPPLERIFNLVGANIRQWWEEMPKVQRSRNITIPLLTGNKDSEGGNGGASKSTLETYMRISSCLLCKEKLPPRAPPRLGNSEDGLYFALPLCPRCLVRPAHTLLKLKSRIQESEQRAQAIDRICRGCANLAWGEEIKCDSKDCPVFYSRVRERGRMASHREGVAKVVKALEDLEW